MVGQIVLVKGEVVEVGEGHSLVGDDVEVILCHFEGQQVVLSLKRGQHLIVVGFHLFVLRVCQKPNVGDVVSVGALVCWTDKGIPKS